MGGSESKRGGTFAAHRAPRICERFDAQLETEFPTPIDALSILGLDIGTLRIGAAGSNEARIATPLETIPGRPRKGALARVVELVEERGVNTIVVGLPLELDGTEGIAVRKIRRFTTSISEALPDIPIVEWDERLTSVAAESALIESGVRRKERKQVIDQVAAVLILQGYLDSLGPHGD